MFFVRNLGQVKRSVSPIISVILLIVIAVIIVSLILNWGTAFTTKQMAKVDDFQEFKSIEGFITINKTIDGNIWLYNNHNEKDVVITGYKIRTDAYELEGYSFLNTKIDLDSSINFDHKSEINLEIACFPSNDFYLDLYTDEQKYIPLKVKINSIVYPNSCLDYGLVGHWDFKDIGSLTLSDKSGNGNDGTIHNTTINEFWAQGNGKGVFDGIDDYVDLGDPSILDTNLNSFSVSFWISANSLNEYSTIISKTALGGADGWGIGITNSLIRCELNDGVTRNWSQFDTTLSINTWYYVVSVFDRDLDLVKVYLDSIKEDHEIDISNQGSIQGGDATIGGLYGGVSFIFNGLISDIKMYDRALSSQEVEDLYDLSKGRYQ